MYMNNERYYPSEFGDKAIKRESIITLQYIPDITPSWFYHYIQSNQLNDNTDFLNFGNPVEKPFFNNKNDPNILESSWSRFPTKDDPTARYKFLSAYLSRDPDFRQIYRKTNGIADVLSSVGGLARSLIFFGNMLIMPYSNHAVYSLLSKILIRVVPSTEQNQKQKK